MEQVFKYIIDLGASVMMPVLFTIIGLCIGMKFGKALKSGLYVGVGFVGLNIVTKLLTDNFTTPLDTMCQLYDWSLRVFDMGWPAAAAVAYGTAVGALIIPICLGVNLLMLFTKCTRTVNIDLWNYWHFAFMRVAVVGLFCRHRLLHRHTGHGRPDSREVPAALRPAGHLHSPAVLPELHRLCRRYQLVA